MTMRDSRDRCHFASEDVKEYWWYLNGLPSHAWLRWRYHYSQEPFPYQWLIDENGRRSRDEPEFELMATGVFDQGRYWAVDVAYAKASATEVPAKITIKIHASEAATLSVLPTLWFRNTWRFSGSAVRRRPTCSWIGTASLLITPNCLATPAWKDNLLFYELLPRRQRRRPGSHAPNRLDRAGG
jgi:hypothetical protein